MNFKKKTLIVLLAAAMVCVFALPMTAYGATKITLTSGGAITSMSVGHKYNVKLNPNYKWVIFKSGSPEILGVSISGAITPRKAGIGIINAYSTKNNKLLATKYVTVYKLSNKVKANLKDITLQVGESYTLKTALDPADSSDVIKFVSADKTIATVGSVSGKIVGKAVGTTTVNIIAKKTKATSDSAANNRFYTVNVKVVENKGVELTAVSQYGNNFLSLDFLNDISAAGLTAGDVYIEDETTGESFPLASAFFSIKYGTVFTQSNFTPGNKYLVRVYGKEFEFTAKYISSGSGTPPTADDPYVH